MIRRLARILLMGDSHLMIVPPEEQKGQIIRGIDRFVEGWLIRRWKRRNKQSFESMVLEAKKYIPFDQLIFLGDLIECVWNERGIITPEDVTRISTLKNLIVHILGPYNLSYGIWINPSVEGHFLPGDHELGYKLPLSIDPTGGISINSIQNFQETLGPLFDAWKIGNFHLITISSSLFSQKANHLVSKERKEVESLVEQQKEFLTNYLRCVSDDQRVLLFLHDPDALEVIDTLPGAEKIHQVFCGHMHAESSLAGYLRLGKIANSFWGRLMLRSLGLMTNRLMKVNRVIAWAKGNLRRFQLFRKYRLQVVPAPSGMLGHGSGFMILELYNDNTYEIQRFGA